MDRFTERLKQINLRRQEIEGLVENASSEELEKLEEEVRSLNEESKTLVRKSSILSKNVGNEITLEGQIAPTADGFASVEYRQDFRDYVNRKSNKVLQRIDATTDSTGVGAIIPTTIMDQIVHELKDYGEILPLVTFTNFKGGVRIPVAGTKPTATWVTEGSVADKQKQEVSGYITFAYYKLQMRVAITLVADTVSLDSWEAMVAQNIAEAFGVALETAIINGAGSTEPLGIVNDLDEGGGEGSIPVANQVDVLVTDLTYDGWINKLMSSIPIAYRKRKNGVILMNPLTFDKYVWGLVDTEGHPIARIDHGIAEGPQYRFLGKRVILTELLPSFDEASAEDVFVVYADLSNYMINTNLQMTYRQYFDEDTDEYIRKATMIADGKLSDAYGVVVLVKTE